MSLLPARVKQSFYDQVWSLVRQVPVGQVATYGQIGQLIPTPDGIDPDEYKASASRWVGSAMAACPDDVPWQRVINSQGKISNRPDAGRQKQLLLDEGVVFIKDKLNLNEFQWRGPGQAQEPRQASLF